MRVPVMNGGSTNGINNPLTSVSGRKVDCGTKYLVEPVAVLLVWVGLDPVWLRTAMLGGRKGCQEK